MLNKEQVTIEQLHDEISLLKNFEGDMHYTLKHLKYLKNDLKFHEERLSAKCEAFKRLSQKHLGVSEYDAEKAIEAILEEHRK